MTQLGEASQQTYAGVQPAARAGIRVTCKEVRNKTTKACGVDGPKLAVAQSLTAKLPQATRVYKREGTGGEQVRSVQVTQSEGGGGGGVEVGGAPGRGTERWL